VPPNRIASQPSISRTLPGPVKNILPGGSIRKLKLHRNFDGVGQVRQGKAQAKRTTTFTLASFTRVTRNAHGRLSYFLLIRL
jgi:hypothetical protein